MPKLTPAGTTETGQEITSPLKFTTRTVQPAAFLSAKETITEYCNCLMEILSRATAALRRCNTGVGKGSELVSGATLCSVIDAPVYPAAVAETVIAPGVLVDLIIIAHFPA